MVLFLIADLACQTGLWITKRTYDLGYYMIYGIPETTEEKILKQIKALRLENAEEKKELIQLRQYIIENIPTPMQIPVKSGSEDDIYQTLYERLSRGRRKYADADMDNETETDTNSNTVYMPSQ